MSVVDRQDWERFLAGFPQAHILQTAIWGDLKSGFSWSAERIVAGGAGAQILFRRLPLGFCIAYIPKGPVGTDWTRLWPEVDRLCRERHAILLKVEPDGWQEEEAAVEKQMDGFRPGGAPIQPRRTIIIDLGGSEDAWLERMKQKTRYNVRLAQRKGIQVKTSEDVDGFHALMKVTGVRDGFGVHSREYYRRVYDLFHPLGKVEILQAEYEGEALAAVMVFAHGKRAWYFYGASNDRERSRMPVYLLQWEAMRWAHARGCVEYDLWGVPDEEEQTLEEGFESRKDGLWSVYRFKRGFGGSLRRALPTWEKVYHEPLYRLYRWYSARGGEG